MTIRIIRQPLTTVDAPWVAAGIFDKEAALASDVRGTGVESLTARLLEEKEIKGSVGETVALYAPAGFRSPSLLLFGLGSKAKLDARAAFSAGVALAKRLAGRPRDRVAVSAAGILEADASLASALVEGIVVGMQGPGLHKSEPNRHPFPLDLVAPEGTTDAAVAELERQAARGEVVGQSVNMARMLVNTPPSEKPPAVLAEVVRKAASGHGVAVEVWDAAKIREERFGGLLAVAAGSDEPPSFVTLEYSNGGDEAPVLAIVGKGVTFDSGGLSLKPSASMEDMKSDMTGAAVAAAAILAASGCRSTSAATWPSPRT